MAAYTWDLGFDWTADADPSLSSENGSSVYYLQNGFVSFPSATAAVAAPVNLQTGDTVTFYLYDVTPGASSTGQSSYSVATGSTSTITFDAANQSTSSTSPFSASSITIPTGSSDGNWYSEYFEVSPAAPVWTDIPQQTITVSSGRYLVGITLFMTDGTTTKQYSVDPEMIVGSAG